MVTVVNRAMRPAERPSLLLNRCLANIYRREATKRLALLNTYDLELNKTGRRLGADGLALFRAQQGAS